MNAPISKTRWGTEPVLRNGYPVIIHPRNVKDYLHYLIPFARHRFLNNEQLSKLSGRSFDTTERAIHVLKSEPNFYLKLCDEQNKNRRFYQNSKAYYELSPKGEKEVAAQGISFIARATSRSFDHEVMVSEISSSLDIGAAARDDVEIIWWNKLRDYPQVPEATRQLKNPFALPVRLNGKDTNVYPDYSPLVIHRKNNTKSPFIFLPGFEADTDSESFETATAGARTIRNHFEGYLHVLANGTYEKQYGAKTCYLLFVFTSEGRRDGAIELLNRIPGAKDYARFFLFKWMPTFKFGTPAPATGHILLEPCIRGTGKEFILAN